MQNQAGTYARYTRVTYKKRVAQFSRQIIQKIVDDYREKRYYLTLSLMGTVIGYVQLWRVSDLTFEFGGIIFFLIYGISLLTLANAAAFMESVLSQYTGRPSIGSSEFVPIAKGLAYSSMLFTFFFIAYNVQLAIYPIYYFLISFMRPLPWLKCPNETYYTNTLFQCTPNPGACNFSNTAWCDFPSKYHFKTLVYGLFPKNLYFSDSLGISYGNIEAHIIVWLLAYFAMYHDTRATAIFSTSLVAIFYLLLIVFISLSLLREGSLEALQSFFTLEFQYLTMVRTWQRAISQAFLSMGVGLTVLGNLYYKADPPIQSYKLLTKASFKILIASFISTIFVYSTMGVVSAKAQVPLNSTRIGPGLFIIAISEACQFISNESHFFSFLVFFLLMIFCCTTMSLIAKGIFKNVKYLKPTLLSKHPLLVGMSIILPASLLGFPVNTKIGLKYFNSFHYLAQDYCVLFIVGLRFLMITFCYGLGRFCDDIHFLLSWYPNRFYRYIWGASGFFIFGLSFACTQPWLEAMNSEYADYSDRFTIWGLIISILLCAIVASPTIVFAISAAYKYYKAGEFSKCVKPNPDFCPKKESDRDGRKKFLTVHSIF